MREFRYETSPSDFVFRSIGMSFLPLLSTENESSIRTFSDLDDLAVLLDDAEPVRDGGLSMLAGACEDK